MVSTTPADFLFHPTVQASPPVIQIPHATSLPLVRCSARNLATTLELSNCVTEYLLTCAPTVWIARTAQHDRDMQTILSSNRGWKEWKCRPVIGHLLLCTADLTFLRICRRGRQPAFLEFSSNAG